MKSGEKIIKENIIMARAESNEFKNGTIAPDFTLLNTVDNSFVSLNEAKGGKGTVIMFICNHCPFVIHVNTALVQMANEYQAKGIQFIAVSSNEIENYPEDRPELMQQVAKELNYPFPYLYDESQEVAKAYDAACTPDFYVFDADLKSVYHGQLDDARPGNGKPVSGQDIRNVMDNLLEYKEVLENQKPSVGCGIKWRQ
jgi:peroxiredoxin